ncbi:MAG: hypothetical protein ACI8TQ_002699 [Planctomycetota bacterium]|jgi:hypothetical protein
MGDTKIAMTFTELAVRSERLEAFDFAPSQTRSRSSEWNPTQQRIAQIAPDAIFVRAGLAEIPDPSRPTELTGFGVDAPCQLPLPQELRLGFARLGPLTPPAQCNPFAHHNLKSERQHGSQSVPSLHM